MWPGGFLLHLMILLFPQAISSNHLDLEVSETLLKAGGENRIIMKVEIKEGYHIQTNELDENSPLVATTLEIKATKGINIQRPIFPTSVQFSMKGAEENLEVYEGMFEIIIPVSADKNLPKGKMLLEAKLTYQTCNRNKCFFPRSTSIQLPLTII